MYGVRCCAVRPSLKRQTSVYEAARHGTQEHSITVFLCVCVVTAQRHSACVCVCLYVVAA
jgi:hypothetical protein